MILGRTLAELEAEWTWREIVEHLLPRRHHTSLAKGV